MQLKDEKWDILDANRYLYKKVLNLLYPVESYEVTNIKRNVNELITSSFLEVC